MKLWIATGNRHKLQEIGAILGESVNLRCQLDIPGIGDVAETGCTYHENAEIKARALWELVKEPVFADDSGLEVDALGGRPGIHSQRYSAPNPTHEKNIAKLLSELGDLPEEKRSARFRCVVCYINRGGTPTFFEGTLEGRIGFEPRGKGGFGFDPVFMLPERGCSVAELSEEEKNRISHRGRAVEALKRYLKLP